MTTPREPQPGSGKPGESADSLLREVLQQRRRVVWRDETGAFQVEVYEPPVGILSGSFHPLHDGHEELRRTAEGILEGPVYFELPVINADKPSLDVNDVAARLAQFPAPVAVTGAATFVEKARLFPGVTFVVGADTAERILQPRFYAGSEAGDAGGGAAVTAALREIAAAECRFLVACRQVGGRFCRLGDLEVPAVFRDLFEELPPRLFRHDVSSTEIRRERCP